MVYSYNVKNLVKSGDVVKVGMVIGLIGCIGWVIIEYLYFEMWING